MAERTLNAATILENAFHESIKDSLAAPTTTILRRIQEKKPLFARAFFMFSGFHKYLTLKAIIIHDC